MLSLEKSVDEVEETEVANYDLKYDLKYINVDQSDTTNITRQVLSELDRIIGHIITGERFKKISISYSLVNGSDIRSEKISGKIQL